MLPGMAEPIRPGQPAATTPSSGCGKWALGCALGCGGLVVLFFVSVAIAGWWFVTPGTQHPTTAAVAPDSQGAFRVADLGEDEGAREALEAVIREASRLSPGTSRHDRPVWVQSEDPAAMAGLLSRLLPREGTLAFQPVPGRDEPSPVLVLNLRGLTRPLRMLLESDDHRTEPYRGVDIVGDQGGDTLLAMVDGTLVVAEHPGAMRGTIDRLLDGTGHTLETTFEILEPPAGGALLSGATSFERGQLAESLREGAAGSGEPLPVDPSTLEPVSRLELVVDDLDSRSVHLRLGLAAPTAREAEAAARSMAVVLQREMAPAVLRTSTSTRGSAAILDVEVSEWVEPVARWMAEQESDDADDAAGEPARPVERTPGG
jgi:hypothetical protein